MTKHGSAQLVIIGIIAAMAIVSVVGLVFWQQSKKQSQVPSPVPQASQSSFLTPSPKNSATPTPPASPAQVQFSSEAFGVKYPGTWEKEERAVIGGGQIVALRPQGLPPGELHPIITIGYYKTRGPDPFQAFIKPYRQKGLLESVQNRYGYNGILFTETLPGAWFTVGNPQKKDVISQAFVFENSPYIYQIESSYYVEDKAAVEKQIESILNTIVIK